jgi:UDP-N-acetylglucosamine:LPS N-acetylglucosamine transferase
MIDAREIEGRLDNALARELTQLAGDADLRRQMGQNASRLSHPDAARRVASLIAEIVVGTQVVAA